MFNYTDNLRKDFDEVHGLIYSYVKSDDLFRLSQIYKRINKNIEHLEKEQTASIRMRSQGERVCSCCWTIVSAIDIYCRHCGKKFDKGESET